ncbi:MAG: FHA domain-containing protein [Planctomycetota bacterium]|nr:FHA domain-containing protein [Planctomycetota bacterium]
MSEPATITVTRGPARGQFFELEAELVHIGRAESNQVVLEDTNLADHHASIVFRNGRYAIFTPLPDAVSIDGSAIPPQRWVWLPGEANIGLGQRTSLRFATSLPDAASDNGDAEDGPAGKGQRKGRKGRRRKRQLAKFVTDAQGESRVQLGEDGQLPELSLDEELTGGKTEQKKSGSNSLLLSLVLVVSTALSIMLLIVEGPGIGATNRGFEFARTELKKMLEDTKPKTEAQPELAWRLLVRDALSAAARSDRTGEQVAYDRLLNLLNAEDRRKSSLTGDEARDQRLKEMIATLKAP